MITKEWINPYNKSDIAKQGQVEGYNAAKCYASNISKCLKNTNITIKKDKGGVWLNITRDKFNRSSTRFDDGWEAWMGLNLINHFMVHEMGINIDQSLSDR